MQFEDAFAFAASVGITQKVEEIRWLFELVGEQRPRVVLEIGLDEGGTLFLWSRAAAPDGQLISVDTRPAGPLGNASPFPLVRRSFARDAQRVDLVLGADSHDAATAERIAELLAGRPVDFLFIDGDHSRDGVWQDVRMYGPLVRPGGLIAFHDVSTRTTPMTEGTAQFWSEFKADHETDECVAGGEPGFGIGVYGVPGEGRGERF
jgi:cephalosporin hydroxylase